MPTIKVHLDIPDEVFEKLLTGEYTRSGGTIRRANGSQITNLLQDAKPNIPNTSSIKSRALDFALNNPLLIKEGLKTGKVIMTGIYKKVKNNHQFSVINKTFKEKLTIYLMAVKEGSVTLEQITDLIMAIEDLKTNSANKYIKIPLSLEELEIIGNLMFEYTKKLSANTNVVDTENLTSFQQDDTIINLQHYLETQKRIFELSS
ncbi:hypothetical protein [Lysinibacillus fusiformis]|uniref:hypothetical protein n=1 Tax=Lysinibacillus fusiformis TaxID=28031 RepID=UPI00355655E1